MLEVDQIPADMGLNWLVQRHAEDVVHVPVENEGLLDLDTPEDYERLKSLCGVESHGPASLIGLRSDRPAP